MDKMDLISMDTDSFTMALAGEEIEDLVLDSKREEWDNKGKSLMKMFLNQLKYSIFSLSLSVSLAWFVHKGCKGKKCENEYCNKRLPGPFKNEYKGNNAYLLLKIDSILFYFC